MKKIWIPQTVATLTLTCRSTPGIHTGTTFYCGGCAAGSSSSSQHARRHSVSRVGLDVGIMAGVYNPILRVHLNREIWSVVNVATMIVAVASVFALKSENEGKS